MLKRTDCAVATSGESQSHRMIKTPPTHTS